jgi:immune inhibitor A
MTPGSRKAKTSMKHAGLVFGLTLVALACFGTSRAVGTPTSPSTARTCPSWTVPEGLNQPIPVSRLRTNSSDSVLVILIQTPDELHTFEGPSFDSLLFSQDTYPTGSMRDYFREISYGRFDLQGILMGWYTAENPYSFYTDSAFGIYSEYPNNAQRLVEEAVLAADSAGVDFSQFDNDDDGVVDGLVIVHQGPGGEFTGDPNDIWSHMWAMSQPYYTDGVYVYFYSMDPELGADGSPVEIEPISVFCHEYLHMLGCPDLYDYDDKLDTTTFFVPGDYNDHPVQDWCIMGYGGYGLSSYGKGASPPHLCGYLKYLMGWIEPVVLDSSQMGVTINEIETTDQNSLYRVRVNMSEMEYFLIENRNPRSSAKFDHLDSDYSAWFEWFTPGPDTLDGGLLITHIDENMWSGPGRFNDGTPMNEHYGCLVMDAGYNSVHPYDDVSEFTEWWYPWEFQIGACFAAEDSGQTEFTPYTTPSSNGYSAVSNIRITNISHSGSVMTFDFALGIPGVNDEGGTQARPDPQRLSLYVSPNPAFTRASLTYQVKPGARGGSRAEAPVDLRIFDLAGRLVRVLPQGYRLAGKHIAVWDGRTLDGSAAPAGVYLCRLEVGTPAGPDHASARLILVR